jgi:transposase
MPKPLPLKERDTVPALLDILKKSWDVGQKMRIRGIISVKKEKTRKEIAEELSVSRDTVGDWVKKYNEGGVVAMETGKGGRPAGGLKRGTNIFDNLTKEIERKKGYWSIPLMHKWIKEHEQSDIPEITIWYRMDKLKYSYKSSRPHPYKGDKEKQDSFKKGELQKNSRRQKRGHLNSILLMK